MVILFGELLLQTTAFRFKSINFVRDDVVRARVNDSGRETNYYHGPGTYRGTVHVQDFIRGTRGYIIMKNVRVLADTATSLRGFFA